MVKSIEIDEDTLRQIEAAAEARGVSAADLLMQLLAPATEAPSGYASNVAELGALWTPADAGEAVAQREDAERWLGDCGSSAYWAWPDA